MKKVTRLNSNNETRNNAATELLQSVKFEESNKVSKAIKNVSFEFSNVRTAILAYVANDKRLSLYSKNAIIKVLRTSKKDSNLYKKLLMLTAFTYKRINAENKTFVVRKAFTVKSVLNACDLYIQTNKVQLTQSLIESISFEREVEAINNLKKSISKLQKSCNLLQQTIEQLSEADNELSAEYEEQLSKVEKQLQNKIQMLEYVNVKSNRMQIK